MNRSQFLPRIFMKNNWLILGVIWLISCAPKAEINIDLPYFLNAEYTPYWLEDSTLEKENIHQIPEFLLTNQNGESVNGATLEGKIYVANFFFTICPSVCPKMTNNLLRVQDAYRNDDQVMIVSHSVMPWVDSVHILKAYAERNQIDSKKWLLLTGDKSEIYQLGRQSYFADEGFGKSVTDESDFLHTENVILIDAEKHIRGIYNGTIPLEMTRLIEDIGRLKKEQTKRS